LPNLAGIDLPAMERSRSSADLRKVTLYARLPERYYWPSNRGRFLRLRALLAEMFVKQEKHLQRLLICMAEARLICPDSAKGCRRLQRSAVLPDMRVSQPREIGHVHRRVGERDFYSLPIPVKGGAV